MVTDDYAKSGGIRPETTEKTTEDTAADTGPDYTDLEPISVPRGIDALAFRGLVWDVNGVRKLPLREIALRPWLYKKVDGFEEDEKLFPASVAKALINFRQELGDISGLDENSTATRVSLTIGSGHLPDDDEGSSKDEGFQRAE